MNPLAVAQAATALEKIANVLSGFAQPTRLDKPNGDGLIKILGRIATALETIAENSKKK